MRDEMGKVVTPIKLENWLDAEMVVAGARKEKPCTVETEASEIRSSFPIPNTNAEN